MFVRAIVPQNKTLTELRSRLQDRIQALRQKRKAPDGEEGREHPDAPSKKKQAKLAKEEKAKRKKSREEASGSRGEREDSSGPAPSVCLLGDPSSDDPL